MARVRKQKTIGTSYKTEKRSVWQVAVYVRLSKEDGNDESESVVNQKKILIEYLENSFEGEYNIFDFYVDDGLTGTDDSRENFMRMIQDIEQKKINCVICKTLARAFRNYSDQGYYLEYYFQQKVVRFISTGDPQIDTYKNPEVISGYEVPITGIMNDRYSARTSNDIRRTFNTKRRNGEFIGAFPPYGYLKDPQNKNRLILDEDIAPIKRDMLMWIIRDGMSMSGVAKKLNELGIPNPAEYKRLKGWNYRNPMIKDNDGLWAGTAVKKVLLNKVNLGHMVQGKQRVVSYKVHDRITVPEEEWFIKENTHAPTFTQEEYDTLERILQRDTRTPNGERKVHLFSGFLRCYDCRKALQRSLAKNHTYYACRTYREKSKNKCTKHSIREDILEKAVLNSIQTQIVFIDSLQEIIDEINESKIVNMGSKRLEKMLLDKEKELEKNRTIIDGLYLDWKWGELPYDNYQRMKTRCEDQVIQLTKAISKLTEEQKLYGQGIKSDGELFTEFLRHGNIQKLDRSLLLELIDTIYVHENREITIVFRFTDELKRVLEYIQTNPRYFLPLVNNKSLKQNLL